MLDPPVSSSVPVEYYNPAYWMHFWRTIASYARVQFTGASGDNLFLQKPLLEGQGLPAEPWQMLVSWLRHSIAYRQFLPLGTGWKGRGKDIRIPWSAPPWLDPDLTQELRLEERFVQWREHMADARRGGRDRMQASMEDIEWCQQDVFLPDGFVYPQERDPYLDVRLLRFVLALPPVPWRFQKHLLRVAMARRLPRAVTRRPKTLLGLFNEVLLDRADAQAVDQWEPHPDLNRFVLRDRVPHLVGAKKRPELYRDLRPLLLNTWLRARW